MKEEIIKINNRLLSIENKIDSIIEFIMSKDLGVDKDTFKSKIKTEDFENINNVLSSFKEKLSSLKETLK